MTDQHSPQSGILTALQAFWAKLQFVPAPAVISTKISGFSMPDLAAFLAIILLLVQIASGVTANWDRWSPLPRRLAQALGRAWRWCRGRA